MEILKLVEDTLKDFLKEKELEIYNLEYVKEGKDNVLRLFIDKADGYISTDECEMVSDYLSDKLDELDPIEKEYVLEVSSPGMDRVLFKEEHFKRYEGELVRVYLKEPIKEDNLFKGQKEMVGILKEFDENSISIEVTIDTKSKNRKPGAKVGKGSLENLELSFEKALVKEVRLEVIF